MRILYLSVAVCRIVINLDFGYIACAQLIMEFFMQAASEFIRVDKNHQLFPQVRTLFEEVIAPIYGDQKDALEKIGEGKDRACEVLVQAEKINGIIVYKTRPTDEFAQYGAKNALELKTLFVVNASQNSGRGLGSKLLERVENAAKPAIFSSIVVTVSETKTESCEFFKKKQFVQVGELGNKFKAPEFILAKVKA